MKKWRVTQFMFNEKSHFVRGRGLFVMKHTSIVWQPSDQDRGVKVWASLQSFLPVHSEAFSSIQKHPELSPGPAPGDTRHQQASVHHQHSSLAHTRYILHLDNHPIHTLWQRSFILKPQNPALSTHPSKLWDPLWYVRIEGMKHFALVLYWLDLRDSVKHLLPCLIEIYLHYLHIVHEQVRGVIFTTLNHIQTRV